MATPGDINLLKTKTRVSPELLLFAAKLKKVGWLVLGGSLMIGLGIGGLFVFFTQEKNALFSQKQELLAAIAAKATKESLFVSLSTRVPLADRALTSQRPWGQVFDTISAIGGPSLSSFAVDDKGLVTVSLKTRSIEDIAGWVSRTIGLVGDKRLRNPQLMSLALDQEGTFTALIAFIPL